MKLEDIEKISGNGLAVDAFNAKISSAKRTEQNNRYSCSIRNGKFFAEQIQQKTDGSANDDPFRQIFYLKRVAADVEIKLCIHRYRQYLIVFLFSAHNLDSAGKPTNLLVGGTALLSVIKCFPVSTSTSFLQLAEADTSVPLSFLS